MAPMMAATCGRVRPPCLPFAYRRGVSASTPPTAPVSAVERGRLQEVAIRLEYGTIAWNLGEAVLTIALGIAAGSLALIAFGTDSIIEMFASAVVVWHERKEGPAEAHRTSRALRLVAVAFVALAVVLGTVAVRDLVTGRRADESIPGIVYLALTACVMFGLAVWKRRVATSLASAPLRSEATLTFLDGILAVLTLTGLALNAAFGWWWADPAAALFVALAAANEGRENLREATEVAGG
jgi:divalent metal cation (Fe/Co/Zn/Cd) transporter